ncbi:hypothetical protein PQX77_011713 [Marasmius sp. AFHP31]|nr:hypothetical protein PQX77_011713 [Marasmius sp. AFHP31]
MALFLRSIARRYHNIWRISDCSESQLELEDLEWQLVKRSETSSPSPSHHREQTTQIPVDTRCGQTQYNCELSAGSGEQSDSVVERQELLIELGQHHVKRLEEVVRKQAKKIRDMEKLTREQQWRIECHDRDKYLREASARQGHCDSKDE